MGRSVIYTEDMAEISLRLPFNGDYPMTFAFGSTSENEEIKKKFAEWGIVGHNGIDYGLPEGTEVVAAADGKVIQSGENGDFGTSVTIEHPGEQSLYAHLNEVKVSTSQEVKAGDVIGLSGKTGAAFGEHLHFAIKPNNSDANNGYLGFIDPSPYFGKLEEKPATPSQPEVKEEVKEIIKEVPVEKEVMREVVREVPVVNQEEVQKQVEEKLQERLKAEQDERRKLANEARAQKKKDNLNKILEFMRDRKVATNDDVRDFLHVSQSTATNYLTELMNRGMLKREGERGGTKYTLRWDPRP